ncbi:MAG: RNA 3'-terminal phosphate cyclase [Xenococcaceae cyanobacterium MO_188.B19]|nr:RNA 3'-terminal phosphate cyclase [Xenococcaceae cyanobacterium MO_188.B19]
MINIDGSWGEGGGQILRTCLSLATITGQSVRIEGIRANRPKPGLAAQHLTSVMAAATLCQAEVRGDILGSKTLEFSPTCPPQAGKYTFDVAQAREGGSAGAITLILQTILMPLALANGSSQVILKGGTHVAWSPPVTYIEEVYLPTLKQLGVQAEVNLKAWGWYPRGGGEVEMGVTGSQQPLTGLELLERGAIKQVRGLAVVTELPSHIPQRMANRATNLLEQAHLPSRIQAVRGRGVAPGAGIFLTAEYEHSRAGFSALGGRGIPAEQVAENAVEELLNFQAQAAPIDRFLGDQLLLPLGLSSEMSQYRVASISQHLRTNAGVIEGFKLANILIEEDKQLVRVIPTK